MIVWGVDFLLLGVAEFTADTALFLTGEHGWAHFNFHGFTIEENFDSGLLKVDEDGALLQLLDFKGFSELFALLFLVLLLSVNFHLWALFLGGFQEDFVFLADDFHLFLLSVVQVAHEDGEFWAFFVLAVFGQYGPAVAQGLLEVDFLEGLDGAWTDEALVTEGSEQVGDEVVVGADV